MESIEVPYGMHGSPHFRIYLAVGMIPINTLYFFDRRYRRIRGFRGGKECTSLAWPDVLEAR